MLLSQISGWQTGLGKRMKSRKDTIRTWYSTLGILMLTCVVCPSGQSAQIEVFLDTGEGFGQETKKAEIGFGEHKVSFLRLDLFYFYLFFSQHLSQCHSVCPPLVLDVTDYGQTRRAES